MEISVKRKLIGEIYNQQELVENISSKEQLSGDISISKSFRITGDEISGKQKLVGEIYEKQKLVESISGKEQLSGDISISNIFKVDYEEFEGPYEVKPITESPQIISTKRKLMKEDLTVLAISYAEVTNNANGITVTIGE